MVSKSLDHATDSVFWRSSASKCSMALSNNDKTNLVYFRNSSTVFEFDKAIDISSQAKGQNFSSVKAAVVAHGSLNVNQHAACDFKIS